MKLRTSTKKKPRGKPFERGNAWAGNRGGKPGRPFAKIVQRLSIVAGDALSEAAPDEDCIAVGLPLNSSKARVIVEALYRASVDGNVGAAEALFRMTESAKIRVQQLNVMNVDSATLFARAKSRLEEIAAKLPALPMEVKSL
jgi:hypothetical protein